MRADRTPVSSFSSRAAAAAGSSPSSMPPCHCCTCAQHSQLPGVRQNTYALTAPTQYHICQMFISTLLGLECPPPPPGPVHRIDHMASPMAESTTLMLVCCPPLGHNNRCKVLFTAAAGGMAHRIRIKRMHCICLNSAK